MKTSEDIKEITKALVAFHSEVGRITKDGTNPHLRNRYATIDQIIEEIRPILASHGLFIMQLPTNSEDGGIQMVTRLYHISGQWMESPVLTINPQKKDAQGIGSAITYARRYSLTSFLGLNTGEDDDGHRASGGDNGQAPKQQSNTSLLREKPTLQPPRTAVKRITEPQRKKIFATAGEMGLKDTEIKALVYYLSKGKKDSVKDLTSEQASYTIQLLQESKANEIRKMIEHELKELERELEDEKNLNGKSKNDDLKEFFTEWQEKAEQLQAQ